MSLKGFQLLDNEISDKSNIKRDFSKKYHQQGAIVDNSDQNIETVFTEYNNYHQFGNAYFPYGNNIGKDAANPADGFLIIGDAIKLMYKDFAYCFKEASLATTG